MNPPATVLVTGPQRAGVTGLRTRLGERMPGVSFVETELSDSPPVAVVFVISAVAAITESDCALAARVAANTDAVVVVVAKIDDHRGWRQVLDASRERLASYAPRFRSVPWVGAAAAPRLGEPDVDEVVDVLAGMLADPGLASRSTLRGWEVRLRLAIGALQSAATDPDRLACVEALQKRRDALMRARRLAASQRTVTIRASLQQARVELTFAARQRCATLRADLVDDAAEVTRAGMADIEDRVRRRCRDVVTDVDDLLTMRLQDLSGQMGVSLSAGSAAVRMPGIGDPPRRPRRLESGLTAVLGGGFGFGVGLVLARFLTGLAPGLSIAGSLVGGAVGLLLTAWVVGARALLSDRAMLGQWIGEAVGATRAVLEERIVTRLLVAESTIASVRLRAGLVGNTEGADGFDGTDGFDGNKGVADGIAVCEAELAELDRAAARAEAVRRRCEPGLRRALAAIGAGLPIADPACTLVTDR